MTTHRAEFADGPLDGVRIDVNAVLDQVVFVFRDRILRYEVDQELTLTEEHNGEETCVEVYRLVQTRDQESFDEDLLEELKK